MAQVVGITVVGIGIDQPKVVTNFVGHDAASVVVHDHKSGVPPDLHPKHVQHPKKRLDRRLDRVRA